MKFLGCLLVSLVVCFGCTNVGDFAPVFFAEDAGTDTGASSDSDTDTDMGTETETDVDGGVDSGEDAGSGIPCDAGACCVGGEVAVAGTSCVADVLPEDVSESFSADSATPYRLRCSNPDVCGSPAEVQVGQVVCTGLSASCFLDSIAWGVSWFVDPYAEYYSENEVCNPMGVDRTLWWVAVDEGPSGGAARYSCLTNDAGCEAGKCVPQHSGTEEECSLNWSDFYCGSCEINCFENGGSTCGGDGPGGPICECGAGNPACDGGFRCVWDYIVADFTCIPE